MSKAYGALQVTDDVSLAARSRRILAVIGPNGAGKTSLIGQISGELPPDSGTIWLDDVDVTSLPMPARCRMGLARTFQSSSLFASFTALDNVRLAVQAHRGFTLRMWRDVREDQALTAESARLLERVALADRAHVLVRELSHGERRQLELALVLAGSPKFLLLDEPTAGMGTDDSLRMAKLIGELKESVGIILVEHDMPTVFSLADEIAVLVRGRVVAHGAPEEIRGSAEVRRSYLGSSGDA